MNPLTAAADFLTRLEQLEAGLLAWGVADGSFSEAEVDDHARRFLDEHDLWHAFPEPDRLVQLMEEKRLLFPFRDGTAYRSRTRSAETVRLMTRLRQLFPKHTGNGWRLAPTLVADARFLTRARSFPNRNVPPSQLNDALGGPCGVRAAALAALVGDRQLAGFQVRAAVRLLGELDRSTASGTVVCAGTGSGKTLAFYLPALAFIAGSLDASAWVQALAIYPRNELLKDQFTEAFAQCRRLRGVLPRAVRLGALFGPTPRRADAFESRWPPDGWQRVSGGYVCPLLRCPECDGDMVWPDADRQAKRERLKCVGCDATAEPDEIVLTRDRLKDSPPDVLFTTTEMLNQRMSDSRFGKLFGVGQPVEKKPRLLLLDEVHTYSGTAGAQAAFLLRRWQHAARCRPHVVGLSATLRDAPRFFATLTGLPAAAVEEVSARPDELTATGTEYLLALRGDPASGGSLLSVSIQTAMLLTRVLDPRGGESGGLFGRKLFAFTDDLDVTNRLFFNLRDAEGQDSWGNPKRGNPTGSLATLRADSQPQPADRFCDGQNWGLCEWVGHSLRPDVFTRVGRTSSQDAGVDADADQIVATAALEVGFNDPTVGAVIQHKAPIDPAAFLQRKGRAGRNPLMRPWTVVVLSDYGRDRAAYQAYDLLFDPELPARELPVGNRHVRRMQAVFATLDWFGHKLEGFDAGSVWQDVAVPVDARTEYERDKVRKRQQRITALAEGVLDRPEVRDELAAYLRDALSLPAAEVGELFWEPPRPLLTAVLPTLLRRLRTGWRSEFFEHNAPLPEFVPRALFQDLSAPEVAVVTPDQNTGDGGRRDAMRVSQALSEFAPGRVSRRFGVKHRYARHWVPLPALCGDTDQTLPLSRFIPHHTGEWLGRFDTVDETGAVVSLPCVRPWELHAADVPNDVLDSSNSFPDWRTQLVPLLDGLPVPLPQSSAWAGLIAEVRFFTHATHCPVEVRRFAVGCEASIGFQNGDRFDTRVRFTDDDARPAAVGFAHDADAVVLRLRLPPDLPAVVAGSPELLRRLRPAFFRHRVRTAAALDGVVNTFARDWLAQAYLCAVAAGHQPTAADVSAALDGLFRAIPTDDGGADPDAHPVERGRGHARLLEALQQPGVMAVLSESAVVLGQMPDAGWAEWLTAVLKATVGTAAADAVARLCPDVNAREVLVDVDAGPRAAGAIPAPDGLAEVWLSETAVGGGGVIEKFQQRYATDPRRFADLLSRAVEPSDFETADVELTRFVRHAADPADPLARAAEDLRAARLRTHADYGRAFDALLVQLRNGGFTVSHTVVAALAGRVLRAGTSERSDRLLKELLDRWAAWEGRAGFEIDARTFAWLASADAAFSTTLGEVVGSPLPDRGARLAAVSGLVWARRASAAGTPARNPFADLGVVARGLVLAVLPPPPAPFALNEPAAEQHLRERLANAGVASAVGSAQDVWQLLVRLTAEPIDTGTVLAHPHVRGVSTARGVVTVTLELPEAAS
jgi:hypothetical protein